MKVFYFHFVVEVNLQPKDFLTSFVMGMFKNNEAFHFIASYAHVCLDFKDQTYLEYVLRFLCSSCKTLLKSNK